MMKLHALGILAFSFAAAAQAASLVPPGWDPALAGDQVLERLAVVTAPQVKGAHDAEMVLVGDRAYVVAEVNDRRAGESAGWPEIYAALSIVNLKTLAVEKTLPVARSEQVFENATLPVGACFVPRIIPKDAQSLRCYFASEQPGQRQSQTWFRDFDLASESFENRIHKAQLKTAAGVFCNERCRHCFVDTSRTAVLDRRTWTGWWPASRAAVPERTVAWRGRC